MKTVFEAIKEMRELTKKKIPFSFSYMSYNSTTQKSDGIVEVRSAKLNSRVLKENHKNSEMVEAYIDLTTLSPRWFYQPLLMTFNNEKVTLNKYE